MKRKTILIAFLLSFALLLSACGNAGNTNASNSSAGNTAAAPAESADKPAASDTSGGIKSSKDHLIYVITADPANLDPQQSTLFGHHHVTRQMYETLVVRNQEGELVGCLADEWEYLDDTTLVFKLKQGVKFHNGEELKASDVLFSLRRAKEDGTTGSGQISYVLVDKCYAIDDYTVAIVTDGPCAIQLYMLESSQISIFSEKGFKDNGGSFDTVSYGTGPYKLVSYTPGDSVEITAFEDYRIPGQPYIRDITFRVISDTSSRAIEAETGGADIVYQIGASDIARVSENPKINLVSTLTSNSTFITFNVNDPVLQDIRVRKALSYGIDRATALKMAYGDYGALADDGIFSPGLDGRHPDMAKLIYEYNPEKAKELLAEAGYADGLTVKIICQNNDQMRMSFCEALQAQLAQIGVKLELEFAETSVWTQTVLQNKHQLAIYGFSATTGEVGRNLIRWLPGSTDWGVAGWTNDEFVETVNKAVATMDPAERFDLYAKAQEIMMEDCILIPYWFKENNAALQKDVENFWICPTFETVYLQEVYFK